MKHLFLIGAAALLATPALAETKTYDFKGFTRVSAAAGVEVDLSVGRDYSIVATSSGKGLERLRVELVGDELQIGRKHKTISWGRGESVKVVVTAPALSGVDVSSGASLDVVGVDADAFSIEASSGGSLDVAGRCNTLSAEVSSGGSIDAAGLQCASATADASSGGSADLYVSESFVGDASSGGSIDVAGSPKSVSKDTSSGGSVSVD